MRCSAQNILLKWLLLFPITGLWASSGFSQQHSLPTLNHVSLEKDDGCHNGACSDIQPWVDIQFSHKSCSKKAFEVQGEQQDSIVYIRIIDKTGPQDCRGPEQIYNYIIEVSDLFTSGMRYVVLNPLAP